MTRRVEELSPREEGRFRIYVCGVTVYDHSHLGHARTIILFDALRRYLVDRGYKVSFVQNFTDVDDKIIKRAKELGIEPTKLAEGFIDQYFSDFDRLNVLRADVHPKATEHVEDMQRFIGELMAKGFAYVTSTGVYFDVSKFKGYGKLSGKLISELKAGARVEVDPTKKDPLDFALWKFSGDEPSWESPWGRGRPGWHIECSVMAMKYLGETFDIHGGGQDLIFPHHENEIAQSEARTGKTFASTWMHVGLLNIGQEKMSKSLRNIIPVCKALERWGPNVIRVFCVSSHYHSPVKYSDEAFQHAVENWRLIENAAVELQSAVKSDPSNVSEAKEIVEGGFKELQEALDNDFNTPVALGVFMRIVKFINRSVSQGKLSVEAADILQKVFDRGMWIFGFKLPEVVVDERREIEELIKERSRLRAEKKFTEADQIRERLKQRGVELIDHPDRTVWRKV